MGLLPCQQPVNFLSLRPAEEIIAKCTAPGSSLPLLALLWPPRSQLHLRPVSSALLAQKPIAEQSLVQSAPVRALQTSAVQRDIDSAAKFIGAGAATVGVAGSGAG